MLCSTQQQRYVRTAICISLAVAFITPAVAAGVGSDRNISKPVETQLCEKCHSGQVGTSGTGVNTDFCSSCHGGAHNAQEGTSPSRYSGVDIHGRSIHSYHSGSNTKPGCVDCHGPPACSRCHSGHAVQDTGVSKNCQSCHGRLPDPNGHQEQRLTFRKSMHGWMRSCSTCHTGEKLHFKDLAVFEMNESSRLCYICHSKQYKDNTHSGGITSQECVDCHNPHGEATKKSVITLPSSEELTSSVKELVLNNLIVIILILVLGITVAAEYAFTPKEGEVVLTKSLRVEHKKAKTNAIKVTIEELPDVSNSYVAGKIGDMLDKQGIKLLGMVTSAKDIVLFVNGAEDGLTEEIRAINGVKSAEYSDEYEA